MTYPDPYPPFLAPTYDGLDQCPVCADSPRGICRDCEADLLDSQAEEAADGRRDDHD